MFWRSCLEMHGNICYTLISSLKGYFSMIDKGKSRRKTGDAKLQEPKALQGLWQSATEFIELVECLPIARLGYGFFYF